MENSEGTPLIDQATVDTTRMATQIVVLKQIARSLEQGNSSTTLALAQAYAALNPPKDSK